MSEPAPYVFSVPMNMNSAAWDDCPHAHRAMTLDCMRRIMTGEHDAGFAMEKRDGRLIVTVPAAYADRVALADGHNEPFPEWPAP